MNLEGRQTGAPFWRSELDARTLFLENVKERKQLGCVSDSRSSLLSVVLNEQPNTVTPPL